MILRNCLIVNGNDLILRDIRINGKYIAEINESIINLDGSAEIDLKRKLVSPGFIDMHTHLREPGYEHKETIKTGTKSAAAGGYTLVCAMPNTNPIMDSLEKISKFNQKVANDAIVKVKTFGAITKSFMEDELVDIKNINSHVCGFSNDGVGVQSAKVMYNAMKEVESCEGFISAHCEEESILFNGYVHAGEKSEKEGWRGIMSLTESLQVARDILISETTNCRYHVCHISTLESVELIRNAKLKGSKVSCEVTPHHLLLTDLDVENSNFKMNPPVRSKKDKHALIEGLLDGTIEVIATDHAPHTDEEKELGLEKSPFGIVGLETAFALIYTSFVRTNMASIRQCIEWFSVNPAKILNLEYGHIHQNRVADLTVIDLDTPRVIDVNNFYSKGKNSPFNGIECYGFPVMTIVNGEIVYDYENNFIKGENNE
ncbi:MAG: dihydroorotase [Bacilli bacterium]